MTQTELAKILGFKETSLICKGFSEAKKICPTLISKTRKGAGVEPDYTWNETETALKCMGIGELMIELVKDNFIEPKRDYRIKANKNLIPGMEEFLERWERDPKNCRCCDNCIFLQGRSITHRTSLQRPYCSFYDRMMSSIKVTKHGKEVPANIFVDKCSSWKRADKPLIFYKRT